MQKESEKDQPKCQTYEGERRYMENICSFLQLAVIKIWPA